jgi:hypothetical protein
VDATRGETQPDLTERLALAKHRGVRSAEYQRVKRMALEIMLSRTRPTFARQNGKRKRDEQSVTST